MAGGGGSKGGGGYQPMSIPEVTPVPTADIQAAQGPAFGPTATPNPYVTGNQPAWATGHFAMPWWGLDPFGQPLTQEQMMYQVPPPVQAPVGQTPTQSGITPQQLEQLQYQDWLNGRAAMEAQIQADANNYDPGASSPWANWGQRTSLYGTQYDPRTAWKHKPESAWNNYDRALANQQKARMRAAGFKV